MALSRPLQPRDRRKRPARKGRAKAACAKTNTDWQLRKVRKILDTTVSSPQFKHCLGIFNRLSQ